MKKHCILYFILAAVLACCTIQEPAGDISLSKSDIEKIRVTVKDFVTDDNFVKSNVTIGNYGASFTWAENDTIGIFPNNGYQAAFPMTSGAGTKNAEFDGGGWALRASSQYMAYYPFEFNNRSAKSISVSYSGQHQTGNANTSHLGKYDYMAAAASTPENGNVTFEFKHLGVLVQWKVVMPSPATVTSLSIEPTGKELLKAGKIDLTTTSQAIEATEYYPTHSILLSDISTTKSNEEITVYMMMPPVDLSGQDYFVHLSNDLGQTATAKLVGQNFEAGKAYSISLAPSDFQEGHITIADNRGKVVDSKGGTITLKFISNMPGEYILSDDATKWITPIVTKADQQREFSFNVEENTSEGNRRATIKIKGKDSNIAVEYTVLQAGKNAVAITEDSDNIPAGVLYAEYPAVDADHGVDKLLDNNSNTYYEVARDNFAIYWESPYPVMLNSAKIGLYANEYRLRQFTFDFSTDGKNWNGTGMLYEIGTSIYNSTLSLNMSVRAQILKFSVKNNHGGATTRMMNFGLSKNPLSDKPISSFQELMNLGSNSTVSTQTSMGTQYENKHVTTDSDREWLANPSNEPALLPGTPGYTLHNYEVNLYPFGKPVPADINQRGIGDCSALAVFAQMAYMFPDFIKSIITDNQNGTYTVAMYDPQGAKVNVAVQSTFLGDNNGLGANAGKDGKANWATILEKAVMKWNYIYQVNPDINGIGSERVAPLFTGNGSSFAISPDFLPADKLKEAVDISLQNKMIVIGGFKVGGLSVGGPQTVTLHAYSFMFSTKSDALFAMRNPWGHSPEGRDDDDGILNITDDGIVPPTIDLRIIYPGAAEQYAVTPLTPYMPPQYTTKAIFDQTTKSLVPIK